MTKPTETSLHFTSELSSDQLDRVERLLFFNANQSRYHDVIIDSIERFGEPRVRRDLDRVRLYTSRLGDVQTLFAVTRTETSSHPVAAVLYSRTSADVVTLLHVAADPEFAGDGPRAHENVTLRLIGEVIRAVTRIKGVERVEMLYGAGDRTSTEIRIRRR